jgi:hypothetical protein
MTRAFYQLIIRMHPPAFRRRFGDEMMSVFDDATGQYAFMLTLDALTSFGRQWFVRNSWWKLPLAGLAAFIQLCWFGSRMNRHQYAAADMEAITPSVEQLLFFALILMCTLFVVIMFLIFWNTQFQRRRSGRYKTSGVRTPSRTFILRGQR